MLVVTELLVTWLTGIEGLHGAGILHRDISSDNIMVDRSKPDLWVILNDLDLAGRVEVEGEVSHATARHRTGTLPFMALELLEEQSTRHRLRHDLESLFYVAVWWAARGTRELVAANSRSRPLRSWNG